MLTNPPVLYDFCVGNPISRLLTMGQRPFVEPMDRFTALILTKVACKVITSPPVQSSAWVRVPAGGGGVPEGERGGNLPHQVLGLGAGRRHRGLELL